MNPPLFSVAAHPAPQRRAAFTLVELLVVLAIVGLLAALFAPLVRRVASAGQTAKASANLRQIGALMSAYTIDNNACLPLLIDWRRLGSGADTYTFWQNVVRKHAGMGTNGPVTGLWLPDLFYDPVLKEGQHLWGGFGANDSIILGLGNSTEKDSQVVYGSAIGTPLVRIGSPAKKVLVTTAKDSAGSRWTSSWYFAGREWVAQGESCVLPKPDARHNGRALCLFADGHTEAMDVARMSATERRTHFLPDDN